MIIPATDQPGGSELKWLGLDLGSVSLNLVLIDGAGRVLVEKYIRHHGQPLPAASRELTRLKSDLADFRLGGIGLTGAAGKVLAELLGTPHAALVTRIEILNGKAM